MYNISLVRPDDGDFSGHLKRQLYGGAGVDHATCYHVEWSRDSCHALSAYDLRLGFEILSPVG
jgi:hypothetical protein